MKILFAASEARPFIASGGLADVAGALPKALCHMGDDCRVVIPLYADMKSEMAERLRFMGSFNVRLSWRNQYCGLFTAVEGNVTYYFIDNEQYFKRRGLYGYYDDCERYAFFSMAVLEMCKHTGFWPDVIHANDWQTALVPVYLRLFYQSDDRYRGIRTVFTIHNIGYQGQFDMALLSDVFSIPWDLRGMVEYDGCINLLKGGIEASDRVNTVSPTYAKEILDPYYGHGLDRFLVQRSGKLSGILNGIDLDVNNPETDPRITKNFGPDTLSDKRVNTLALKTEFDLADNDQPLIGIVTRLTQHKGIDLITRVFDDIMNLGFQVVVLGSGDYIYEEFFRDAARRYPHRVGVWTGFVPELAARIYAGADFFLMPSQYEPCGLAQMIALRYGTIPIVRKTGGLADSIRDFGDGDGNGFTFWSYNAHDMLYAIERAHTAFYSPEFPAFRRRAMLSDFSWDRSAKEYQKLYEMK